MTYLENGLLILPYAPINMGFYGYQSKTSTSFSGLMTYEVQEGSVCLIETHTGILLIHNDLPEARIASALVRLFNQQHINPLKDIRRITLSTSPKQAHRPSYNTLLRALQKMGIRSLFQVSTSSSHQHSHVGIHTNGRLYNQGLMSHVHPQKNWGEERYKRRHIPIKTSWEDQPLTTTSQRSKMPLHMAKHAELTPIHSGQLNTIGKQTGPSSPQLSLGYASNHLF